MVAGPKARATYEDVLAAPGHVVAEVLFGVLYTHPRPRAGRGRVAAHRDEARVRAEPFDAIELELASPWNL